MPSRARIRVPHERIADFCRRHHIRRLALFGSVLRDDFRPESDVDVLVEFEPGQTPGFGFVAVQEELSRILGRRVDLRTPNELSDTVDHDMVWRIVSDELPVLTAALERALAGHGS